MNEKELTYEKAVERLDEIVSILEKNEVTLDEALSLF
ncbi:MAG: exodeoxyribonuclease VII small subunit [Eubacterium sp.]|nr:exodeoxyribonuclease VII small subunit [Eubacterium sp.]